jgi:AcrR family transcriptional regulator
VSPVATGRGPVGAAVSAAATAATVSTVSVARGRPRSAEADRAINDATLALLQEVSYRQLTMAGVAERAGVSTATLYRRVTSKEDLVVGALASVVPSRPPADTGSLEGDLTETLNRMAATLGGSGGRLLLALAGEAIRHPLLGEAMRGRLTVPFRDNLVAMLDRAVGRGEIPPPEDPDLALNLVLGALHYRLMVSNEPIGPAVVARLVPMLLRALGAGSGAGG